MSLKSLLVVIVMTLPMLGCKSGGGDSSSVDFTQVPTTPLVIDADIKITAPNGDEVAVPAPWFKFNFKMSNSTANPLTIVAMKMTVLGSSEEVTATVDSTFLGDSAITLIVVPAGTAEAPGTASFPGSIYFSGLPKNGNFNYTIMVEPLGWFGTQTEQVGRYKRSYIFSTQ